ncbi:MAG TPA: magnesium/cobalt transporter CorA [Candidatus Dormibacteraeota bacterium]|nr:magnesium/cobalt transporter CorA [Candidatus Dormibacteraeota bacterium]
MPPRLLVREPHAVVERAPHELSELRDRPCWLDIADPTSRDLDLVAEELGLHPLAVEDAKHRHQRPKIDQYDGHYFVVFYAVDRVEGRLGFEELSIFVAKNAIVTVHEGTAPVIESVEQRWRDGRLRDVGMLLHALLDTAVDEYFPIADALGDAVDAVESTIVERGRHDFQTPLRELFLVKRQLLFLRQHVAPERDVLAVLARGDLQLFPRSTAVYFQDVYDHVVRVTDEIDTFRDLASNVIDAHLAAASNRLNEVMKVLTSVATILLVVGVITSFFGQNFTAIPYGSAEWFWGTIVVIVVSTVGLVVYFRRLGWL